MLKTSINNSTVIKKNSAIEYVQWPVSLDISEWQCSDISKKNNMKKDIAENILAIQTTRVAPVNGSKNTNSPYQAFNLGLHVGDYSALVEKNRQCLHQLLPKDTKIQWFEQVHGAKVAEIFDASDQAITADAAITSNKNTCLAIMTADCLPILIASKYGDEIAAIHGGWRPLAANIISNTLAKMNTSNENLFAWLGPCISAKVFEVGSEVKAAFVQQDECFNLAFIPTGNGKYLADLHKIARLQLEKLGVNQISVLPECTYANTDKYYSYRKNAVTGRMATLICIR